MSLNAKKRLSQAIDRGRERAEARRAKRGGRQSWVVRKLAVGIVFGLMCYAVRSIFFVINVYY